MGIDIEKVKEAKNILGVEAANIIAREYPIEDWDEKTLKGKSIFREEKTPSLIWNKKENYFKDFSSGNCYDIINFYMDKNGMSYADAVMTLFDKVNMEYDKDEFYDHKVLKKKRENLPQPFDEPENDRMKVEAYMMERGISPKTLDYCHVKQAKNGWIAYQLYDIDGVHVSTKYRVCHDATNADKYKWLWQQVNQNGTRVTVKTDTLFNIDKIDITKPVLIVEGFNDCLACVESGFFNVVSIPDGANVFGWIEENYETLESIKDFIIWYDDDEAGKKNSKVVADRLGNYRVKMVEIPSFCKEKISEYFNGSTDKADANNVLMACGKDEVIRIIEDAKDIPNPRLKRLFEYDPVDITQLPHTSTGLASLDKIVTGNFAGDFIVLTGSSGCVDCDTEFFDGSKWKKISDYVEGDKVLQYNEDGTATLVSPNYYIKEKQDILYHFRTKYGVDQCLSDNHTVYYIDKFGSSKKEIMSDFMNNAKKDKDFKAKIVTSFKYNDTIVGCDFDTYVTHDTKFEEYKTKDGYMYCFNVPSHLLVFRRDGCIFVTGNCGKSTLTLEMSIIAPIEEGHKVFVFSGEASGPVLLGRLMRPLAGPRHIRVFNNQDKGMADTYMVHKDAKNTITDYYRGKIWLYDDNGEMKTSAQIILDEMVYAYRKYGVTHFLLDNLMTIATTSNADDKYSSQTEFVLALKKFTRQYGVTVFLVAHGKKPQQGKTEESQYDVAGAAEIVNLADRCYSIKRLQNDAEGYDNCITVLKDRHDGKVGQKVKLYYDRPSNRIYGDVDELKRKYRWENGYKPNYDDDFKNNLAVNFIKVPVKNDYEDVFGPQTLNVAGGKR